MNLVIPITFNGTLSLLCLVNSPFVGQFLRFGLATIIHLASGHCHKHYTSSFLKMFLSTGNETSMLEKT